MFCNRWLLYVPGLLLIHLAASLEAQESIPAAPAYDAMAIAEIERKLLQPVRLDFVETPLEDVIGLIRSRYEVPILFDRRQLTDAGVDSSTTMITITLGPIPLRSALPHLLTEAELDWTIRNGSVIIGTYDGLQKSPLVRVYPVADLAAVTIKGRRYYDFDSVIDLITDTIDVVTWQEVGGEGKIEALEQAGVLVIAQTLRQHDQIEALLATIRRTNGWQAAQQAGSSLPRFQETKAPATSRGRASKRHYALPHSVAQPRRFE